MVAVTVMSPIGFRFIATMVIVVFWNGTWWVKLLTKEHILNIHLSNSQHYHNLQIELVVLSNMTWNEQLLYNKKSFCNQMGRPLLVIRKSAGLRYSKQLKDIIKTVDELNGNSRLKGHELVTSSWTLVKELMSAHSPAVHWWRYLR